MTRKDLRKLIEHWMEAAHIIERIRRDNRCGGSGEAYEPALNARLDNILATINPRRAI